MLKWNNLTIENWTKEHVRTVCSVLMLIVQATYVVVYLVHSGIL